MTVCFPGRADLAGDRPAARSADARRTPRYRDGARRERAGSASRPQPSSERRCRVSETTPTPSFTFTFSPAQDGLFDGAAATEEARRAAGGPEHGPGAGDTAAALPCDQAREA